MALVGTCNFERWYDTPLHIPFDLVGDFVGDVMNFGERLREARKRLGWSQLELAKKTGIRNDRISDYEREVNDPSFFIARCLADALGVSLDWLAGREEYCNEKV